MPTTTTPTRTVSIIPATKITPCENKEEFTAGENIADKSPHPKRVAAYCRVSTEDDHQHNSYAAQIEHYTHYIGSHPGWICAGIFADEGLSGTQTSKRREFNRLMRFCRRGEIDIILCKSISRFARNTVDCLTYIRELKFLGIAVIFEKENLNTLSLPTEFLLSLHASFAQAESESISRNITWGIEKSFRAGRFPYHFKCMMGYRYDDSGNPVIIEEEATVIREIFRLFIAGNSTGQIAIRMTDLQVMRRCGSSRWSRKNVEKILRNEKYAGFAILQKTYTVNCLTHERARNNGERAMYLVENCLPPIIDKETFDEAQAEFERRGREWREECERRKRLKEQTISADEINEPKFTNSEKITSKIMNPNIESVISQTHNSDYNSGTVETYHSDHNSDTVLTYYSNYNSGTVNTCNSGSDLQELQSVKTNSHDNPRINTISNCNPRPHPTSTLNRLLCCPYCGSHYRRAIWKSKERRYAVWRCAARLDRGNRFCPNSVSLHEDELSVTLSNLIIKHYSVPPVPTEDMDLYISRIEVWNKNRLHIWFADGNDFETNNSSS